MVPHPFIYEINTWVWLDELSVREGSPVDLAGVPGNDWDAVAALGFDVVWLMGVWERSPAGIATALENAGLMESFHRALPDFQTEGRRRLAVLHPRLRGRRRTWAGRRASRLRGPRSPSAASG